MNILLMTNTFTPHIGGVTNSIVQFAEHYKRRGHSVKVIAPEFDNMNTEESNVVRIPAIRNFNHTDFSFIAPIPYSIKNLLDGFEPDIVHSHHPFLVGSIALRVSHTLKVPLVFTHHTKYEDYTHNVSLEGELIRDFARNLATNYANTCDQVFAPSQSMRHEIIERGVTTPVEVVPTGVETELFAAGDRNRARHELGISPDAFVVGHLGRLTKEKNIPFLARSVISFFRKLGIDSNACFVVFGEGPASKSLELEFEKAGLSHLLILAGRRDKAQVPDAYHCMDVFAFASQSETQGMVLTEAMAAGVPVVAADASGVREVVRDRFNGRMLREQSVESFADALAWVYRQDQEGLDELITNTMFTANEFSMPTTAALALSHYERLIQGSVRHRPDDFSDWTKALLAFEAEWQVITNVLKSAVDAAAKQATA